MNPMEAETLDQAVRASAAAFGDRSFFLFGDSDFSRVGVDRASEQIAAGLASLGVSKGDHVALMMPNRPEWVFTWLAITKLGAVLVPVNVSLRGDGLAHTVDHSDAKVLVAGAEARGEIEAVRSDLPKIEHLVAQGDDEGWGDVKFSELMSDAAPPAVEVAPTDPIEIIYTSGTTGLPKGVLQAHGSALAAAKGMAMLQQLGEGKTVYCVLPLYHSAAQFVCFTAAMLTGARVAIAPRFSATAFWDDVRRYQATSFNYYGAMLSILMKQPELPDDDDNPVEIAFGAAAPADVWEDFERRFGVQIIEAFGQTEGGALMNPPGSGKVGSMGIVAPGWEAKILDDDLAEVPTGEIGELCFRPVDDRPLTSYYKDEEASAALQRGGWQHTGDLARVDEEGFFWYVDRKSDFLRRRGQNISSLEVQRVVARHPAVADVAAYGIRDELGEDEVAIAVVTEPGAGVDPGELVAFCQARMARTQVPRYVRFVDELPKTHATARQQKYKLRQEGVTDDTWDREAAAAG